MKICIIGKDSYIGNHIDEWLSGYGHSVFQLDVLYNGWESFDFSCFDAIIHVAGIVHRPNCTDEELYKRVNVDMPIQIARSFKENTKGQRTFVFLSSMAVYGASKRLSRNVITEHTQTNPTGLYGKSKKAAEEGLLKLQDTNFNVVIIRPPNVYGRGCKGRYFPGFLSVANRLPFIPMAYTEVKQSMLYIDNLCELIRLLIEYQKRGIFMPQDEESVSAVEIIKAISLARGRELRSSRLLGFVVKALRFIPIIKKAYGGVEYDKQLSVIPGINYRKVRFSDAMKHTVN